MKERLNTKRKNIILVEDQPGDTLLFEKVTATLVPESRVTSFVNGVAFSEWINTIQADQLAQTSLIFLDINLPQKDGFQCLKSVKENPILKHVPTIFLTTSSQPAEIHRAYQEGINSYIVKPLELQDFRKLLETVYTYWFKIVSLSPSKGRPKD